MDEKKQFSMDILNGFVNILVTNIASKYLKKLKQDKKNPHKLIENYLDKVIFLVKEDIKISTVSQHIDVMEEKVNIEFDQIIKTDKEYEDLVKELNFVFNLIKYEEIQFKVLISIYENFLEFNIKGKENDENIKFDKGKDVFDSIVEKFNSHKEVTNLLSYF